MRDDNVDSYMAVFNFQLCNQQTDNRYFGYIPAVIINAFSIYLCLYTRAYGHTRACHEGGREGFRTTCVGMIRRTATSAANRTAIMRRHGEEKREEAEGDRPNADKARTREWDRGRKKEREMATGRVCTDR